MVSLGIWIYRVIFVGILRIWNGRCGIMPFHKPFCGEYRYSFQDFFRYRQRKEIPSRNNPMSFYVKRRFCPILGTTSFRSSGRGLLLWSLPIFWVPSAIGEYGEPWDGPQACSAFRAGVPARSSVGYTRYGAAAVLNEALRPLNPPGTAAPGAVLVCAAAGSFGALIMKMIGPMWTVGNRKEEAPNREEGGFVVWEAGKF